MNTMGSYMYSLVQKSVNTNWLARLYYSHDFLVPVIYVSAWVNLKSNNNSWGSNLWWIDANQYSTRRLLTIWSKVLKFSFRSSTRLTHETNHINRSVEIYAVTCPSRKPSASRSSKVCITACFPPIVVLTLECSRYWSTFSLFHCDLTPFLVPPTS